MTAPSDPVIRVTGWKTTTSTSGTPQVVETAPLPVVAPDQPPPPPQPDPTVLAGRRSWSLLHRYRGCDPQWVELWEYFIPAGGGCSCKAGYKEILKDHPFDYSSPEAFFASGVALHNAVNRKLGKPELTLEDARKLWIETQGGDNASTENTSP
jgi:hypothetical protein